MNLTKSCFSDFAREATLRNDYSYISYTKDVSESESYSLLELFDIKREIDKNYLESDFLYAEIGDVNNKNEVFPNLLNFSERQDDLDNEPLYKKIEENNIIKCQKNDILIAKVRPNLKKIVFIEREKEEMYFTSAFICLRPKKMSKILYYALRTIFLSDILALSRMGKGYPTINETDLKSLKFNKKTIHKLQSNEEELLSKIEEIENEISELKMNKVEELDVINNAFKRILDLNYNVFDDLKNQKVYTTTFDVFSSDIDLRFSHKFQHPIRNHIEKDMEKITEKRIKDDIKLPVMTGKGVSPKDYMENGDYRYIGMSDIKSWYVDVEHMKYVSKNYFESNKTKRPRGFSQDYSTTIQEGDILMSRSGEGSIGKVALVDQEVNAVFSDFIIRIRLDNYNSKFAYYFFRTEYFQYLVHIYKKGLGNNTNIFPNVIEYFPLPNILIDEQNKIVEKIDQVLNNNLIIENKVEELTSKIEGKFLTVNRELKQKVK